MTTSITGQGITAYKVPDDALSNESKNAVQNKVINGEVTDLQNAISQLNDEVDSIMDDSRSVITISEPTTGFWEKSGTTFYLKTSADTWHCIYSNKIRCNEGDIFKYQSYHSGGNLAYFSDEDTCIDLINLSNGSAHIVVIPSGCKYVMFQDRGAMGDTLWMEVSKLAPVSYDEVTGVTSNAENGMVWTKDTYNGKWAKAASPSDVELLKSLVGLNNEYIIIDSAKKRYFTVSNNALREVNNTTLYTKVTNRIPCEPGWKFSYSGTSNGTAPGAFFFEDDVTNELVGSAHSVSTVTIPDGARYVMFQSYSSNSTVSLDVACVYPSEIEVVKPLKGLKWAAIGDSITALRSGVVVWATLFEQNDLVNMTNMGIGFTGFKATSGGNNDNYITRISNIPSDVELITVSGSFNDLRAGYTLGTIDDADDSTIAGCMNLFFTALLEAFPTVPIGIYTTGPWGSYHSGVSSSDDYVDMLRRMGLKYGIPFYSIYDQTNLRPWNSANQAYYFGSDTTHPNSNGHKLMYAAYKPFIERLVYPKQT